MISELQDKLKEATDRKIAHRALDKFLALLLMQQIQKTLLYRPSGRDCCLHQQLASKVLLYMLFYVTLAVQHIIKSILTNSSSLCTQIIKLLKK